jgi:hypothetical protein
MDIVFVLYSQVVEFTFGDDVIQGFVRDMREVRRAMGNGLPARIHDARILFRFLCHTSSMLIHYVFRVRLHRFLICTVDDYLAGARR